jgi:hypothetical protein
MKQILSDFVNLIYPRPEGEEWKWGEIILVLGMIGFLIFVTVLASR